MCKLKGVTRKSDTEEKKDEEIREKNENNIHELGHVGGGEVDEEGQVSGQVEMRAQVDVQVQVQKRQGRKRREEQ